MKTISCDSVLRGRQLPRKFRCAYCNGPIAVHFESWTRNDDGTWSTDFAKAECLREPSDKRPNLWDAWWASHSRMRYVYWMPLEQAITQWVNKRFRFAIESDGDWAETG
jgi:hypothetical protein